LPGENAVTKLSDGHVTDLQTTLIHGHHAIGPFVDAEPHAKGGLGEVFRATDLALHRTVAVKRLQAHRSGDAESRRRFLVEAEVTARLEHPGIVPVYALYPDAEGGPAYAMRFVEGPTLADAIRQYHDHPPDPVVFLRLIQAVIQICQTVAFAHSRGVIHRDLKPQNVLLGKFGETLVVDWGLAKVVGRSEAEAEDPISEATLQPQSGGSNESETQMGSAVGTPAYMSPEQAAGRWNVIDHRSDIYGLGAVLYTVLTGKPPIEKGDWPEVNQKIQRGQIARPTKVKEGVSKALEAICLKAMTVEPEGRYPSAVCLAADIEHWLADEPVNAFPESLGGRVRRWGKRNRKVVNAGGVFLVMSVIGLSIGAVLLQRAGAETEHQRQESVSAQRTAEAINRFLVDDLLKQADPVNNPVGDQLTVRQLLDKASDRLDAQTGLDDQPEVEAELRTVIGHAFEHLSVFDKAEQHYRRGSELVLRLHGPHDVRTLAIVNRYIYTVGVQGPRPEAEALALTALDNCERALGLSDPETGDAANNLAEIYVHLNRLDEAVLLRQRASRILNATLGPLNVKTMEIDNNLGVVLVVAGRAAEAVPLFQLIHDRQQKTLPLNVEGMGTSFGNLGGALISAGRFTDAEAVLSEAILFCEDSLGPDHVATFSARNLMSRLLEFQGQWDQAETSYLAVLSDRRTTPSQKPFVGRTVGALARTYAKQEKWADAAKYLAELMVPEQSDSIRTSAEFIETLTHTLAGSADVRISEPLLNECWTTLQAKMWAGDWLTAEVRSRYGDCLRQQGKYKDAESHLLTSAAEIAAAVGVPAWSVTASRKRVKELYDSMQNLEEAEKWR
jgi:serine/threonine protein kinase